MKFKPTELSRIIVILEDEWADEKLRETEAAAEGRAEAAAIRKRLNAELAAIIGRMENELNSQLKKVSPGQ